MNVTDIRVSIDHDNGTVEVCQGAEIVYGVQTQGREPIPSGAELQLTTKLLMALLGRNRYAETFPKEYAAQGGADAEVAEALAELGFEEVQ
jgi:hypothetical protein